MSKQSQHEHLRDLVAAAAADFGAAAGIVDEAVAAVLGINLTDLRILDAVHHAGRLTAGAAASAAALSASATSTAIQRLVTAGLLRREPDVTDQRRAALTLTARAERVIDDSYGPIEREGRAELDRWTDDDLVVIAEFLRSGVAFQHRHAARIRSGSP